MNHLVVFSKENCQPCIQAKKQLEKKNIVFHEIQIEIGISREGFMRLFPDVKKVPFFLLDYEPYYEVKDVMKKIKENENVP